MASTSAINDWIGQLATSISTKAQTSNEQLKRRSVEKFRRRIRHHPYGRTNQFDVKDRLDGLEEKFQILNRDDLADALHERRVELRHHDFNWLPDALDLLLRLSSNPIRKVVITRFSDINSHLTTEHDLAGADAEPIDESDSSDPIWAKPAWSDITSDEEQLDASTVDSSPQSVKLQKHTSVINNTRHSISLYEEVEVEVSLGPLSLLPGSEPSRADGQIFIEEIQLIREVLLMIQGYPTSIFIQSGKTGLRLDPRVSLRDTSAGIPEKLLQRTYDIRTNIEVIRKWLQTMTSTPYLQAIQHEVNNILQLYLDTVNRYILQLLKPGSTKAISLLSTVDFLENSASSLKTVASFVKTCRHSDAITTVDQLFEILGQRFFCSDDAGIATLMPIFIRALQIYMKPVFAWLRDGVVENQAQSFFIQRKASAINHSTMWQSGHEYSLDGQHRPAAFLAPFLKDIATCGKTSEFLMLLNENTSTAESEVVELDKFFDKVQLMAQDSFIPFTAAFDALLSTTITGVLNKRSSTLKQRLNKQCGFMRCLDAFDHLYLRKNGVLTDSLESKMFKRMDRCQENWNDRFLVADFVKEIFMDIDCMNIECITVQCIHTSSRSMNSRRRSVKIMGAVAVEYVLPWPVANIIPKSSINAYSRISLHLSQIRRAKYVLERVAFPAVFSTPISENRRDQKTAQAFNFILVTFTNTLYDHFTSGIIDPLTDNMRSKIQSAPTIDAMISIHRAYVHRLQESCLLTKNFRILHESLIALLDMCVRFADLVSSHTHTAPRKNSDDSETSSFMSAQSQSRPRLRGKQPRAQHDEDVLPSSDSEDQDESSDDDLVSLGEGEGYSSFIVLDEDTSVAVEISKLQIQFRRQLDFFVAGLRSVGKIISGEANNLGESVVAGGLEVLAERLIWKSTRGVTGIGYA